MVEYCAIGKNLKNMSVKVCVNICKWGYAKKYVTKLDHDDNGVVPIMHELSQVNNYKIYEMTLVVSKQVCIRDVPSLLSNFKPHPLHGFILLSHSRKLFVIFKRLK